MTEGQLGSQSSDPNAPRSLQIDFYHLRDADLATPLAMLAHKTVASGHRLLVLGQKDSFAEISDKLWSFRPDSFLAHDSDMAEGHEHASVWLSSDVGANQIKARYLALTAGLEPPDIQQFDRIFNLFDGTSETAVAVARDSWRRWSALEQVSCRYFSQDEQGRWSQKK